MPQILAMSEQHGLRARPAETSYYLGRERLIPTGPIADGAVAEEAVQRSCRGTRCRRRSSSASRRIESSSSERRSSSDGNWEPDGEAGNREPGTGNGETGTALYQDDRDSSLRSE